ncbi:transketolase [Desulfoferula mesophila]|uniref:Transketolase n=1 Tax=Desulfoferula mesophila TaxID=3058419 RepID=A0AAU9EFS4_9BACT|nr:transketolase [Desulfoferula mesophilus]
MASNNQDDFLRPASELDQSCINTIRFLAVDAVQKANSGHPGMPMGSAAKTFTLWDRFLRFNPRDPAWPNRDRYVLSAGHGSMLLYALLHLTGYDLPLEQIENFRQWHSLTPGHPEHPHTPGVEATTGPLGQGISNAVGMALAERALAARFNRPGHTVVEHFTYVDASDGDLMEGVASEAASLAGHLKLGKLIVMYDDNHISIEGDTAIAFTEDRAARFEAYGWQVLGVPEGNNVQAVAAALQAAREDGERPSFIHVRTHIGFGSPHKQDSPDAHGSPLGPEEVELTKRNLGWPLEPAFLIPDEVREYMGRAVGRGEAWQKQWEEAFAAYEKEFPDLAAEFRRTQRGELAQGWDRDLPVFQPEDGPLATRKASGKVINALAPHVPELMGGSADLAPSTNTLVSEGGAFQPDSPAGRNLHFGVREHAMTAVLNGMALHQGLIPYGATFLIFSDYLRPSLRLAALSELKIILVFTHDSIGLGEDGPTHQPVEQLLGLRSVPGVLLLRPADANETVAAWRVALEHQGGPVVLVLSRQKLPILDMGRYPSLAAGVAKGGYVLSPAAEGPEALALVATGSEVSLALAARAQLAEQGVAARVVSLPAWHLFRQQPEEYRRQVLPEGLPLLILEAGVSLGWQPYLRPDPLVDTVSVDTFGASAPGGEVMAHYGFSLDNVCRKALDLVGRTKQSAK